MYFGNIYFSLRSNPITLEIFEPIALDELSSSNYCLISNLRN